MLETSQRDRGTEQQSSQKAYQRSIHKHIWTESCLASHWNSRNPKMLSHAPCLKVSFQEPPPHSTSIIQVPFHVTLFATCCKQASLFSSPMSTMHPNCHKQMPPRGITCQLAIPWHYLGVFLVWEKGLDIKKSHGLPVTRRDSSEPWRIAALGSLIECGHLLLHNPNEQYH